MNPWPKAVATAFIFLTRLPMPTLKTVTPEDEGRSLLCFPIVGLVIGFFLYLLGVTLNDVLSPMVLAALLLAFWAAITGGLHLDGLADSADGWLAGRGDINRTLEIMHDSRCGSGALVAVTCVLIMKFAALNALIEQQLWHILIITPVIGRCIAPLLFLKESPLFTPYVQPSGIAKHFIEHCPPYAANASLIIIVISCLLLGSLGIAITTLGIIVLSLLALRKLMLLFIGGSTGDTAGATTEIIEALVLVSSSALLTNMS